MSLRHGDFLDGSEGILSLSDSSSSVGLFLQVGSAWRWHRQDFTDQTLVFKEIRSVKRNRQTIPFASEVGAAHINFAGVQEAATEKTIIFAVVIVENVGLDKFDAATEGKLRQDNVFEIDISSCLHRTSNGVESSCMWKRKDFGIRTQGRFLYHDMGSSMVE